MPLNVAVARWRRNVRWRDLPMGLALLLPSAAILGVFVVYPLVQAVNLGHMRCDAQGRNCAEAGWWQYVDVLRSNEFRSAMFTTFKFAALTVPLGLVFGVALAALADKYVRGVGFFRTVFSSTVATSVAVSSMMWWFLLQPSVGALANLDWLNRWFPVIKSPGLLADSGTALVSVALSSVWGGLGFTFILVTAGLQGIPRDLHDAAVVDGATGTSRFFRITLPLLMPTLLFVIVVLTTKSFQAYGEIDLLTRGGPRPDNPTTTVIYLMFNNPHLTNDGGLRAAVSVLLFGMLVLLSSLQLWVIGKRVHYG